ncbi:nitroreductase family protein [Caproicibacter sp.]|uniref:nitroreductase family protein n=1 Tax=Caproicibacter sp. TaxID=2814884 RepID=UPI003989FA94
MKENEVIRQLTARKSVRAFEDREIPQAVKDEIIGAAFEAPTAGNMMLYTIIDVTDRNIKQQLSVLCDHQPFIAKAPVVLVFLADYERWFNTFVAAGMTPRKPGAGDLLLSCSDALIAAQNTVTAAQSLGVGSCYIGDILENCEKVRTLLSLPRYTLPAAMVVYGYPTKQQLEREKPRRFDRSHIVHANSYRSMQPEELLAMYHEQNTNESIEDFCKRKYLSGFALEMNRSASEYLKNFR